MYSSFTFSTQVQLLFRGFLNISAIQEVSSWKDFGIIHYKSHWISDGLCIHFPSSFIGSAKKLTKFMYSSLLNSWEDNSFIGINQNITKTLHRRILQNLQATTWIRKLAALSYLTLVVISSRLGIVWKMFLFLASMTSKTKKDILSCFKTVSFIAPHL